MKVTKFKAGAVPTVYLKRAKLSKQEVDQLPLPQRCKEVLLKEPKTLSKVGVRAADYPRVQHMLVSGCSRNDDS
jgi:hypothetical protein